MIFWDYGSSVTLLASPRRCVWRGHCKSSAPCSLQGRSQPWWEHCTLSHFAKNRKNMGDPFTCQEGWCGWGSCCCLWQGWVSHHYMPDQWKVFLELFLPFQIFLYLQHLTWRHSFTTPEVMSWTLSSSSPFSPHLSTQPWAIWSDTICLCLR